jgi:peptide/nickel transport system substrate-binding protein
MPTATPGKCRKHLRTGPSLRTLPLPIALILSLALTACGGGGTSASKSPSAQHSFTYALATVPTSLDPSQYQGDQSRHIGYELRSTLFGYNTSSLPDNGCKQLASVKDIRGLLAKRWSYSPNQKRIKITLRNAKSAYGHKLTSSDVKWSFRRIRALKVGDATLLGYSIANYNMPTIKVIDDKHFDILLNSKTTVDTAILTWFQFMILDKAEVEKHATPNDPWAKKWLTTHTANFGPWKSKGTGFQPGDKLVLKPNPNYWGQRGNVTKLIFKQVPKASTRYQLLKAGQVDYASLLTYDEYKNLTHTDNVQLQRCISANRVALGLNYKALPALSNQNVRRAISMAINRNAIIQGPYKGFNKPAKYGASQAYKFPKTAGNTYSYNVAKARKLMNQAGVDKLNLTLTVSPSYPGPESESIANLLKAQLSKINVNLSIKTIAGANQYHTTYHDGSYQAILYYLPPGIADPYYSFFLYNDPESSFVTMGYKNPTYTKLDKLIRTTPPGSKRQKLVAKEAQQIVQHPPFVGLVDADIIHGVSKGFSNWQHPPTGELLVYKLKG